MKKIFSLLVLSILLLQFSNCKPAGKGTLVITLETLQPADAAAQQKITAIIKQRLQGIGVEAENITITPKGNLLELSISGISNYPPGFREQVRRMISYNGNIELWETFTLGESASPLMKALRGNDTDYSSASNDAWFRFSTMIMPNKDMQHNAASCEMGFVKVKDTMAVNRLMDTAYLSKQLPYTLRHAWSRPETIEGQQFCKLILLKSTKEGKARMANPEFSKIVISEPENDQKQLTCFLSGFDTQLWTKMTKQNIGKNIAIVVDGIAYTWPMVQSEINGGVFSIVGSDDAVDYEMLKTILEAGHFPVPVRIAEEKLID